MITEHPTDARPDAAVMHADISGELQRRANLRSYDRESPRPLSYCYDLQVLSF